MFIEERHQAILNWLAEKGSITTQDIQTNFGVSYHSAKRDLRILQEKGALRRTHGGALAIKQAAETRPSNMTIRDFTHVRDNYLAISKKAVSMIKDNDVIYIPSATVGLFMAQNIPDNLTIRVATNSIILAEELRKKENISVIMLGGEMDTKGNCYDAIAIETIQKFYFDKCFITSACISPTFGLSMQRTQAISFWNALINNSKMTIGLYPKEKIGSRSIVSVCSCTRLNTLITDWDVFEDDISQFRDQGITVIIADNPQHNS